MKVIRLKARAYASEVICGKISLLDVPQRLRLRNYIYYIFAMRYYRYDRNILSPLEIWKNDIETLPLGQTRDHLQLIWDGYDAEMRGLAYVSQGENNQTYKP